MSAALQSPQEGRINLAINKSDLKQVKNIFPVRETRPSSKADHLLSCFIRKVFLSLSSTSIY